MTHELRKALDALAEMKFPSLEQILRKRGFGYEADRVRDLLLAHEAWKAWEARKANPD